MLLIADESCDFAIVGGLRPAGHESLRSLNPTLEYPMSA